MRYFESYSLNIVLELSHSRYIYMYVSGVTISLMEKIIKGKIKSRYTIFNINC